MKKKVTPLHKRLVAMVLVPAINLVLMALNVVEWAYERVDWALSEVDYWIRAGFYSIENKLEDVRDNME